MTSHRRRQYDFKRKLKERFEMSDLGPVKYLLGWHIERNRQQRSIFIHQEQYCIKVLNRFGMQDSAPVGSPQDPGHNLTISQSPTTEEGKKEMERIPYREAIGSFKYLMMGTRPDLAGLVRQVSRYLKNPGMAHWRAEQRGLKYLNGTRAYGIVLGRKDISREGMGDILSAYSDADYGNLHRYQAIGVCVHYLSIWNITDIMEKLTPETCHTVDNGGRVCRASKCSARSVVSTSSPGRTPLQADNEYTDLRGQSVNNQDCEESRAPWAMQAHRPPLLLCSREK
jgi:hypothetical protein